MFKFDHKILADSFFWFAIICSIFGVASQLSDKIWIIPAGFFLQLAIISMLGAIFTVFKEKYF